MRHLRAVVLACLAVVGCKGKPVDDRPLPTEPRASEKILRAELDRVKAGENVGEALRAPKVSVDAQQIAINGYRVVGRSALAPAGQVPTKQQDIADYARGLREHWALLHPADAFVPQADVTLPADATFLEGASLVETLAFAGYPNALTVHAGDVTLSVDLGIPRDPSQPALPRKLLQICNEDGWKARLRWTPAAPVATWGSDRSGGRTMDEAGPWRSVTVDTFATAADDLCASQCSGFDVSGGAASFHDTLALLAVALRTSSFVAHPSARFGDCSAAAPPAPPPPAEGIGLGDLGGLADPDGVGHPTHVAHMREGAMTVTGRLPPDVIRRVVRRNFGRLRVCYTNAARATPALTGRVTTRFVIDPTGAVSSALDGGSDLPDRSAVACVVNAFRTLSFPTPESGIVTVTYPIVFSPAPPSSASRPAPSVDPGGLGLSGVGEGGGCPCGCDHSADMADELRHSPRDAALVAIDDALRTIGEREDAGYITERMVEHRLRLLDLGAELGRKGAMRFTAVPAVGSRFGGTTRDGAIVHGELFVHGETTEIVRGAEKLLRASFVLRLDVENTGRADLTLREPTLDAAPFALPVSRWYVAGTDGRPWDGVVKAGERKPIYVIGYAAQAFPPGTEVRATIRLDSLALPTLARARKRWNEVER